MSKKNLHLMILILKNVNFTKYLIDANNVNIDDNQYDDKIKLFCIMLPKMSGYEKSFDEDEKLLKSGSKVYNKTRNKM